LTLGSGTLTVRRPRVGGLEERLESQVPPFFLRRTQPVARDPLRKVAYAETVEAAQRAKRVFTQWCEQRVPTLGRGGPSVAADRQGQEAAVAPVQVTPSPRSPRRGPGDNVRQRRRIQIMLSKPFPGSRPSAALFSGQRPARPAILQSHPPTTSWRCPRFRGFTQLPRQHPPAARHLSSRSNPASVRPDWRRILRNVPGRRSPVFPYAASLRPLPGRRWTPGTPSPRRAWPPPPQCSFAG